MILSTSLLPESSASMPRRSLQSQGRFDASSASVPRRRIPKDSMAWELLLWLYAFASVISLIALTAYQLINLSDLEFDYINPYDSSSRINAVVIPEFMVQGILCASFLLTWHWFPFLIMAPITYYHVNLFMNRRHLIDVTEIFRLLSGEKRYRIIKLSIYFSIFVIVIYRLVMSAVLSLTNEGYGSLESGIF